MMKIIEAKVTIKGIFLIWPFIFDYEALGVRLSFVDRSGTVGFSRFLDFCRGQQGHVLWRAFKSSSQFTEVIPSSTILKA